MSKLTKLVKQPRQFVVDMRVLRRLRIPPDSHSFSRRSDRANRLGREYLGWSTLESWVHQLPASWSFESRRSPTLIMLGSGTRPLLRLARALVEQGGRVALSNASSRVDLSVNSKEEAAEFLAEHPWFLLSIQTEIGKPETTVDVEVWSPEDGFLTAPRSNPIARRVTEAVAREYGLFEIGCSATLESLHPTPYPDEPTFPVDVVYTWVNHLDPDWRRLRAQATNTRIEDETDDARSLARFLSRDELLYSIRSVLEFAPWVGRIWIVSNCSPPAWLDVRHPKIAWVDHSEILPPDALPTFSSHAIESRLQHIPGLANHFIYFNDDFFLLRPSRKWDFFHGNGMSKSFMESYGAVNGRSVEGDADYLNAARNGRSLIQREFGRTVARLHKHTPYALRRDVLAEMEDRFSDEIGATTRSKFRTPRDISTVSFLYHHYAYWTKRSTYASRSAALLKPTTEDCVERMSRYLRGTRRPRTLCLNDGAGTVGNEDWGNTVARFLRAYFPVPCEAESNTPDVLEQELAFPRTSLVIPLEHAEALSLDRLDRWLRELPDAVELVLSANPMAQTRLSEIAGFMRRPRVRLYVQPHRCTLGELMNFGALMSLSERIIVLSDLDASNYREIRRLEDSVAIGAGEPKVRVHALIHEDRSSVSAVAFLQTVLADVGFFLPVGDRGLAEFVERSRTRWGEANIRIEGTHRHLWPWCDADQLGELKDWHYAEGLRNVRYPALAELSTPAAACADRRQPQASDAPASLDTSSEHPSPRDFDGDDVLAYAVPGVRRPLSTFGATPADEVLCLETKPQWLRSVEPVLRERVPLVTVIVTAFNAEDTIEGAVRSLCAQSYENLEILIVDDCSDDGTRAILDRVASEDPRIRILAPARNSGTYVGRNLALDEARGDYITFADADDISSAPRILLQAALLMSDPVAPATTVCFQRRDQDCRVRWVTGQKDRSALVSMMFRRAEVRERLGYFDSVRVNADNEFKSRMIACWEGVRMRRLPATYYFALFAQDSLTTGGSAPIHYEGRSPRLSKPRELYTRAAKAYHERIRSGLASAYMPFPLMVRRFEAPEELSP